MMLFSSSRATLATARIPRAFLDDCTSPTTDTDHTPFAVNVGGRNCTAPIADNGITFSFLPCVIMPSAPLRVIVSA